MQQDQVTELFDGIIAALDDDTREKVTVTPRGRLLLSGLDTVGAGAARTAAVRVAVERGYILAFKFEPWESVPAFDVTITVAMTREELLARFAALSPAGKQIVLRAAEIARLSVEAGDRRPILEITADAVREIIRGVAQ